MKQVKRLGIVAWLLFVLALLFAPRAPGGINVSGSAGAGSQRVAYTVASVDLSPAATTTVLSATEAGILSGIRVQVTAAPLVGAPATLVVTVDGQSSTLAMWGGGGALTWSDALAFKSLGAGSGDQLGDQFFLPLAHNYQSSITVQVVSSGSGGGSGANILVGVVRGVRF